MTDLEKLKRKQNELKEDVSVIRQDRTEARTHHLTLVKKENNQDVSEAEESSMFYVKDIYSDFFAQPEPESDPEVETSPEYKERKQVGRVIEHLSRELASTKAKLEEIQDRLDSISEMASQGNDTQVNETPSDFVDNLPTEHNPMDDIGGGD